MASVSKDGKGWRIRFTNQDGLRKTIRPGKVPKSQANAIAGHIEQLVSAQTSGQPLRRQSAIWLAEVGDTLHRKLEKAGLVEERGSVRLRDFIHDHIARGKTAKKRDAAESTKKKWKAAKNHLVAFFGNDSMRSITEDDAEQFRRWLEDQPVGDGFMSENNVRTVIASAKVFFNAAMRRKLVESNPFDSEVSATLENRSRDFYVTPEMTKRLLEACPDAQRRLLVALWRLAGLRKTEVYHLKWSGVLWDSGRMLVTSPKTACHEGRGERFVPIGPILPWLEAAFTEAPSKTDRIITVYRDTNSNLDKPLKKIIHAAGLIPWPKLFQNMRASCETDWLDSGIAAHVVASWIGHSVRVQAKNYAQVDDHHFDKFNQMAAESLAEKVAHNPAQQIVELGRRGLRESHKNPEKPSKSSVFRTTHYPEQG